MKFLTYFSKSPSPDQAHPEESVEMVHSASRLESHDSGLDPTLGLDPTTNTPTYTSKPTKKLIRKIDFRALGALAVIYQFSWMDRGNIVAGQSNGITQELNMSNKQFKGALVIFFCSYAVFGIPANVMIKMMRPRIWLSIVVFLWGAVMACQGVVETWEQMFGVRLLLGVLESAILPGILYILSMIYARYELAGRLSFIFGFCSLFEPIMALAALGSHKFDGIVAGLDGWQFSFISMGAGLAIMGVSLWVFMLPDVPDRIKFLKTDEKEIIQRRLREDTGTALGQVHLEDGPFDLAILRDVLLDWKLWAWTMMAFCAAVCIFGFGYAVHPIMSDLGYSLLDTQLLVIPLNVAGAISTWFFGWLTDKKKLRWKILMGCFGIAGFAHFVLLTLPRKASRWYFWGLLYMVPIGCEYSGKDLFGDLANSWQAFQHSSSRSSGPRTTSHLPGVARSELLLWLLLEMQEVV